MNMNDDDLRIRYTPRVLSLVLLSGLLFAAIFYFFMTRGS